MRDHEPGLLLGLDIIYVAYISSVDIFLRCLYIPKYTCKILEKKSCDTRLRHVLYALDCLFAPAHILLRAIVTAQYGWSSGTR